MTHPAKSSTMKVPGAKIYYETRGRGPTLVMIPGGATDAGIFADLSQRLADRYTVVAYDPRGNSRSTSDGEPEAALKMPTNPSYRKLTFEPDAKWIVPRVAELNERFTQWLAS